MSWTTIPDSDLDQDSPLNQPLMTALRDNPIAIAQGLSGATVNETAWHQLEELTIGSDGSTITFTTDTSGYRAVRIIGGCAIVSATNPSVNIQVNISGYSTIAPISYTGTAPTAFMCDVTIDNMDSTAAAAQKIISGLTMFWDRTTATNDWDTTSSSTAPVTLLGVKKSSVVVSAVQLDFGANTVDVSEGAPTFHLYGVKRTQP